MQTNPAVEQSKIIRWSESPWNGKGLWRIGFAEEPSPENGNNPSPVRGLGAWPSEIF